MATFDRPYTIFYWSAIVNIALSCTIFSYLMLNNIVTLKSGLEVTQGHWNWYHSKAWMRFPIRLTQWLWLCLAYCPRWSEILVENRDFFIPFAFASPATGVPVGILPFRLVRKNYNGGATRWWKIFEDMHNCLGRIPACVRRTDGQASCYGIMHTRREIKTEVIQLHFQKL